MEQEQININDLVKQARTEIKQYAINEFIEDLNHYISSVKQQSHIQKSISEWYNNTENELIK